VLLVNRTMPELGEVVALGLERGGMQKLELGTQVFRRSEWATFQQVTEDYGDFVRQNPITTEMLNREKFGTVEVSQEQPTIEVPQVPNEQQRLWPMARGFRRHLHQKPAGATTAIGW